MQQNTDAKDIRRRFRANLYPPQIGDSLGLSPTLFNTDPSPSLPMPSEMGGQLGRNIILAAERANLGTMPTRNLSPVTRQSASAPKPVQDVPVRQGLTGGPAPMPSARPARLNGPAGQPQERSFFDIAGRFHDFQAGPKIARPNLAEEFIPVIGPAWDAVADVQDRHYGSAALNAAFAIGDVVPFTYGAKAGRAAWKLGREMGTFMPKAAAIQRKMHKIGLALPSEDVHHIFALNGLGRYVPDWKNSPLFLKVLPREIHRRLHTSWGGMPKFGLIPRLYHGTTDWMKAGAAGIGSYAADGIENVERWLSPDTQPAPKRPKPSR